MPPIIHCVRHAQGFHNLSAENFVLPDPTLTDLGHAQCRKLQEDFPYHTQIDLVTASPLHRTIDTALKSFEPVFATHPEMKLIALSDLQETSDLPCDTGTDPSDLREEYADKPVNLNLVREGWNSNTGRYAATNEAIDERARDARLWLKARPEKEIIVVTHGSLLHYLTQDWEDSTLYHGTGWKNTEWRSYEFVEEIDKYDLQGRLLEGENATVVETLESRKRRGKEGRTLDREQQRILYKRGTQGWSDQYAAEAEAIAEK
ncbi:hypothetical protein N7495_004348 [Penicillium taxi]|uniref:uncharacterized protein n=1 Tax=Penicillium taxi TaxID=168475 RepID=UPI002544E95B|nr:uncharacterized protein N7495_004348 [Penicillium taxi]KAJ5899604.1 hypothetical protein N7495_004348 [Penicillium taxi]